MKKSFSYLVFLLILLVLIMPCVMALGEEKGFTRNSGDERLFSGIILNDGSFIITGGYGTWDRPELGGAGDGTYASIIARYTMSGEMVWEKTLDTTNDNPINDVEFTSNGDLMIAGTYFFSRVDTDGNIIWYERFEQWNDDYYFSSIAVDKDDNFYVETEKKLIKYDKDRNIVKEYVHDNVYDEDMIYSKDKNEIILLHRHIVGTAFDTEVLITGLDTDLNKKWEYKVTPPNNDGRYLLSSITEANDGYIIIGYTFDDIPFEGIEKKGRQDAFILKIDKEGNKIWSTTYGKANTDNYFALGGQVENGNIIVIGDTEYFDEQKNKLADEINLLEFSNETGELVSVKTHLHSEFFTNTGVSNLSCSYGGVVSNENGYVFTGFTMFEEFDGIKPSENPNYERGKYNSFVIHNTQPSKYDVNKKENVGGTINTSSSISLAGEKIVVNIELEEGYSIENITILDMDNNEIEYKKNKDGQYEFIMPDSDVLIDAIFTKKEVNPETTDFIVIVFGVLLIVSLVILYIKHRNIMKKDF